MANDTKILIFMDEEQGRVVRYQCKLRNNLHYGQLNEFYNYPYRMRLDSNLSSFSPLQEGKSTKDIITTFNEMLSTTTKFIDFGKLFSCFNEGYETSMIVRNLAGKFMQLFDCQLQPQMDKSQIMSSTDLEKQLQIVENNSKVFSSYDLTHGLEQSNNFAYQKKRA